MYVYMVNLFQYIHRQILHFYLHYFFKIKIIKSLNQNRKLHSFLCISSHTFKKTLKGQF